MRARYLALIAALFASPAMALENWPTQLGGQAEIFLNGCLNTSGKVVACSDPTALPPTTRSTTGKVTAATITNSSTLALAAATRGYLFIKNESTSATIACSFGGTAVLNTAGDITLVPGAALELANFIPAEAVNCISSAASSPATIIAN